MLSLPCYLICMDSFFVVTCSSRALGLPSLAVMRGVCLASVCYSYCRVRNSLIFWSTTTFSFSAAGSLITDGSWAAESRMIESFSKLPRLPLRGVFFDLCEGYSGLSRGPSRSPSPPAITMFGFIAPFCTLPLT